ncbi:hypothetical protein QTP86_033796, partial [Hemibagrus guttatus]
MYRSVVVKKELSRKAKLSIYQSIYVPTLTYGHELWVMTKRLPWGRCPTCCQQRRVPAAPCSHPPAPWGVPDPSETDIVAMEPSFVGGRRSALQLGGGRRSALQLGGGRRSALLLGCGRRSAPPLGCGRRSALRLGCGRRSAPPLGCGRRVGPFGLAQPSNLEELVGSWVELHFNNGGGGAPKATVEDQASSGDMEKMLLDAQHESGRSSSRGSLPCDSPPRSQTPLHFSRGSEVHSSGEKNSSQSDEDFLERRKEVDNLMKKNADWIWDWSSRPENIPPKRVMLNDVVLPLNKEFLLKQPKRSSTLSIRNTSVMKKGGIFSAEFLKVFLPSLIVSHILAVGLGLSLRYINLNPMSG